MSTSLSQRFADTLTSPFNQHVTCMTVGPTGSGKSFANLALCENLAVKLADHWGGEPRQYFSIENVAIISLENVKSVILNRLKKRQVILLDDFGTSMNARKWQAETNIIMNDIFQTFRMQQNFMGMTLPSSMLIDAVPRRLVHYFIEMEQAHFSKGVTVGKVFKAVDKPRQGKTHFQYIKDGGKILRFVFPKPSDEIIEEYNKKRNAQYEQLASDAIARWDAFEEKKNKAQEPKQHKSDLVPLVKKAIGSGMSRKDACDMWDITPRYYNMINGGK